jgi:predicted N-acetyltransferase YhbS
MTLSDDYFVEQFTVEESDIKPLAELLTSAFLEDDIAQIEGERMILSEENFKLIFGSPSIDKEMFVRVKYKPTNEIVGFLGGISKNLSIDGKVYKVSLPAWLSVHTNHRKRGIATAMGIKLQELAKERDYDAGVAFHEHGGHHGLDASKAIARVTNTPIKELAYMTHFIVRVYDVKTAIKVVNVKWYEKLVFRLKERVKKVSSSRVRLYTPDDIDQIYELTQDLVKKNQVAIVQNYDDLKWKLSNPQVLCVVHEDEDGRINGFINVWEFLLAGFGESVKFGWLDTVHIYNLTSKEAQNLANFLGEEAKKINWKGIQTPFIPYFKPRPLKAANFIFYRKKLGLYLFKITDIPVPDNVESIYFEWR